MSFGSLDFLFIFLPVVVIIHALVDDNYKNIILLAASIVFYFYAVDGHYVWLLYLILSTAFNYWLGLIIGRSPDDVKKKLLWIGVIADSLLLLIFKYGDTVYNFFSVKLFANQNTEMIELLLPLGISYYTFKNISYLHEVYKGDVSPSVSVVNYATYLVMFPQIVSGPIQTYKSFRPMLRRSVDLSMINEGLYELIIGFSLKQIFSNRLAVIWSAITRIGYDGLSTELAWIGVISFSLQLYFDFYGYSLMAVGIGKMLGYDIPQNFDHPYMSRSISEFWRRWHMTLSEWFKENIYFPLGGSRCSTVKIYRNLFIVWLATGIWHGNTLNYIIWGMFLFIFIALERSHFMDFIIKNPVISHIYTLFIIVISWMIFKLENLADIPVYLSRLFPFFSVTPDYVDSTDWITTMKGMWLIFGVAILFATSYPRRLYEKVKDKKWLMVPIMLVLFWYSVYLAACSTNDPFMYGNY